jgi:hypothetical protein
VKKLLLRGAFEFGAINLLHRHHGLHGPWVFDEVGF